MREEELRAVTPAPMSPIRESVNSTATSSPPDRGSAQKSKKLSTASTQEFALSQPLPESDTSSAPLPSLDASSAPLNIALPSSGKGFLPRMRAQSSNADFRQQEKRISRVGGTVRESGRMLSQLSVDATDRGASAECCGPVPYADCIGALQMRRISSGPENGGRGSEVPNEEPVRKVSHSRIRPSAALATRCSCHGQVRATVSRLSCTFPLWRRPLSPVPFCSGVQSSRKGSAGLPFSGIRRLATGLQSSLQKRQQVGHAPPLSSAEISRHPSPILLSRSYLAPPTSLLPRSHLAPISLLPCLFLRSFSAPISLAANVIVAEPALATRSSAPLPLAAAGALPGHEALAV